MYLYLTIIYIFCRVLSAFKESARRDSGLIHCVQVQYTDLSKNLSIRMNLILLYLHVFFNTILSIHLDLVINQKEKLAGFKTTSLKITNSKYHKTYHPVKNYLFKRL